MERGLEVWTGGQRCGRRDRRVDRGVDRSDGRKECRKEEGVQAMGQEYWNWGRSVDCGARVREGGKYASREQEAGRENRSCLGAGVLGKHLSE